jgi:hypothetical protein
MAWDRSAPADPKYKTCEHRTRRAALVRRIKTGEALECTADVCVFDRMPITNPNGNEPDGLHLGHEDDGITYRGPQHNLCNVQDGAVRGNARSHGKATSRRWVL